MLKRRKRSVVVKVESEGWTKQQIYLFFKGLDLTPRREKLTPASRARQLKWTKSFLLKNLSPRDAFKSTNMHSFWLK